MHARRRRRIRDGDSYTIDEEIDLELPERRPEPPVEIQGEPWGWTKEGDKPKGWNPDGHYGPAINYDDPGPYDGEWERPSGA